MHNNGNTCPANDPACAAGVRNGNEVVSERTATAIRNILSGDNACGTLFGKNGRINIDHLDASIRPVLQVGETEKNLLREDRARISRESEERRQALEYVYSNSLGQLPRDVAARVCQVLGYAN